MTAESFSFKYGRMEVIAKLPAGDWLWPGLLQIFIECSIRHLSLLIYFI